jgi:unsaturated rhamnogalacturonyl hydrolase
MNNKVSLFVITFFAIIGSFSCSTQKPETTMKWSVKMADAVMQRYGTLAFYNGASIAGWSYDVALLGSAIDKLGEFDPKYQAYMKTFMDMLIDSAGNTPRYSMESYNLDLIRPATNILTLYNRTGEEKYIKTIPQFIEQLENQPRTAFGGFWHKKKYPNQMWLDGIYMAEPFLAQYAKEFNEPRWFDTIAHQITLIYEKTYDPETGLLYHAWDESREQQWSNPETGQSPHFWSRAMGWYVMALVDVLDYFPENHPEQNKIIEILQNTCDALAKFRNPQNGVWYQVLDMAGKEGNYPEASGSAMYIYAFAKGAKNGYLDEKYNDLANTVFDDFLKTFVITDEDGLPSVTNICGACGLGGNPYRDGSYEYYTSEKVVKNDSKGVAPFILAAKELDR